jgi:glycerol-3-phosphate dehydrogenase
VTNGDRYDLLIVGGGIVGAGIARDAALRGLKVALFERGDFGSGTSSKSSKMIHGGLRYLEHGELGLVFESVSERAVQTKVAPHIVRPQPFLVPIFKGNKPGVEIMNIGLWIYDTLALFRAPKLHKTFRGAKAAELVPQLKREGLKGALEYYDCVTDDARLVLENILDARTKGAACHSYTEVVRFIRNGSKRVRGLVVRDGFTGEERAYHSRAVVVAAGAWTDEFIERSELDVGRKLLRRTKGVHVVFPHERLPIKRAITVLSPVDGRVMFAIPWRGRTVIGTTDNDYDGAADDAHATRDDVQYLCDSANSYFPDANFTPDDVIATWSGLRPLINESGVEDESDVSREHEIFVRDDAVVIIAGGKLTTYRRMAKEVVRKAIGWLDENDAGFDKDKLHKPRTKKRPLPGAVGLADATADGVRKLARQLSERYQIDFETADHLTQVYGVRASMLAELIERDPDLGLRIESGLPYVWAEITFAVRADLAQTIDDVLSRRVPLLLVGTDQGLDVLDRVAEIVAKELGWSPERTATELARYRTTVANSRRFR